MAIVYHITNVMSNKCYIGSTQNYQKRITQHFSCLRNNRHHNIHLQRAFNKYGEENFIYGIVEGEIPEDALFAIEQKHIDLNVGGYNLGPAGGGDNISNHPNKDQIAEKIRLANIKRYTEMSPEQKETLSENKRGEKNGNWRGGGPKCSCGKRMAKASNTCANCRNRNGENNPFYGKRHTEEMKQKASVRRKGMKNTAESILKITGENSGRFIGYYHTPWGIFPSSSQAQKASGGSMLSAAIHRICLNPDSIIKRIGKSHYLAQLNPEQCIGRTYRELGFWFDPKQPCPFELLDGTDNSLT